MREVAGARGSTVMVHRKKRGFMCLVDGCENNKHSLGLCQNHYMTAYRLRKSGRTSSDPVISSAVAPKFGSKICSECAAPVHGKGLCGTHYARLLRKRKHETA